MALSDPSHNPTEAQELFKTSLTADVIHNREISFPPNVGYFPVPPHTFDRSPFDLELAYASIVHPSLDLWLHSLSGT